MAPFPQYGSAMTAVASCCTFDLVPETALQQRLPAGGMPQHIRQIAPCVLECRGGRCGFGGTDSPQRAAEGSGADPVFDYRSERRVTPALTGRHDGHPRATAPSTAVRKDRASTMTIPSQVGSSASRSLRPHSRRIIRHGAKKKPPRRAALTNRISPLLALALRALVNNRHKVRHHQSGDQHELKIDQIIRHGNSSKSVSAR